MTNHLHDIGDLISCNNASALRLRANLSWQSILVGLKYGSLMQTYGGGMDIHVEKNGIGIADTCRQPKSGGQ